MPSSDSNNRFFDLAARLSYSPQRNALITGMSYFGLSDYFARLGSDTDSDSDHVEPKSKQKLHVPKPPVDGCPVNNLPPEILSWIFVLGEGMDDCDEDDHQTEENEGENAVKEGEDEENDVCRGNVISDETEENSDWEDESNGDDGDDSDFPPSLPFQVLVSHVCEYWRRVAIETPSLWSCVDFAEGKPYDKSQAYLERSKGYPLSVAIDCTEDVDSDSDSESDGSSWGRSDLKAVLSLAMRHVGRWSDFALSSDDPGDIYTALAIFSLAPSAPLLEILQLRHEDDAEGPMEIFSPAHLKTPFVLFNNDVPKLKHASFWGVHIDWKNTRFLKNLAALELAYHSQDVRPTFEEFFNILRASPSLESLELSSSGPAGDPSGWPTILPSSPLDDNDPHTLTFGRAHIDEFLTLQSLENLTFEFQSPEYVMAILDRISLPNLRALCLDFEDYDYTTFVDYITSPPKHGGKLESIVGNLKGLELVQLPCNRSAVEKLYETSKKLEDLRLNFNHLDLSFMEVLCEKHAPSDLDAGRSTTYPLLPSLATLALIGLNAPQIRDFVEAREYAGLPVKKLCVDEDTVLEEEDETWLRNHVEEFEYFEASDDDTVADDEVPDDEEPDDIDDLFPW